MCIRDREYTVPFLHPDRKLLERLPYTLLLAVAAASLALLVGGIIGTAAALRAGAWLDTVLMGGVAVGLAVPVFWSALLLLSLIHI